MGKTKFGVYIPRKLLDEMNRYMKSLNISNRSKIIQEALQLLLLEHGWRHDRNVGGIIGVLYKHGYADNVLTDIQHTYLDIIISTIHIHLDKENCMLAIIVKGCGERIKELMSKIVRVKNVKIVRPLILTTVLE